MSNGALYLDASGDPDFDKRHLDELLRGLNRKEFNTDIKLPILITSSKKNTWWPPSWSYSDREEEYGAPITKYSIASNASTNALNNPIDNFINELNTSLVRNN